MRKFLMFAFIIFVIVIFSSCIKPDNGFYGIYISQSGANAIAYIPFDSFYINESFITDIHKMPNKVLFDNYDDAIYVLSSQDATIDILSPFAGALTGSIDLPVGSNPFDMVKDGDVFYVSLFGSKQVCAVRNDSIIYISDTLPSPPEGIAYYGDKILVCCTGYTPDTLYGHFEDGKVAILNKDLTIDTIISLGEGTNPQRIKFVDNNAYILCSGNYGGTGASIKYIEVLNDGYVLNTWAEDLPYSPSVFEYFRGSFYIGGYGMPVYKVQLGTIKDSLGIRYASAMKVYDDSLLYIGSGYWSQDSNDTIFVYDLKTGNMKKLVLPMFSGPSSIEVVK